MTDDDLGLLDAVRVDPDLLLCLGPVVPPGDLRALSRAQALLREGDAKVRFLLEQAQAHLEAERLAQQQQQTSTFLDLLHDQSGQVEALQQSLLAQFEERLTPLVADVLRRMGLTLSPDESVRAAARLFIAQFSHVEAPVLQVSVPDLAALEQSGRLVLPSGWSLQGDASLASGTCRLRTGHGSVSCSVPQMLDRLAQWLDTAPGPATAPDPDPDPEADDVQPD